MTYFVKSAGSKHPFIRFPSIFRTLRFRLSRILPTFAATFAATLIAACTTPTDHTGQTDHTNHPSRLVWAACPSVAPAPFECATATVPLDYAKPDGRTIQLAVIRRPASNPARRLGAIFFNPGGPGGKGTDDMPSWIGLFPAALLERFDLVSWDPRGVGRSTAVRCFDSDADETAFKKTMADGYPVGAAQVQSQARLQTQFNEACERRAGALLAHVSTADTARDLDALRRASGESQMNYLGISYGTLIGATYANLFPGKLRAMVLDGNVEPTGYFADATLQGTSERIDNDLGTSQTLAQFFRACASAGRAKCAFADPGADAAALTAKFDTLTQRLTAHPARLPDVQDAPFTAPVMLNLVSGWIFTVQQVDKFPGWSALADVLENLWDASDPAGSGSPVAHTKSPAPSTANASADPQYDSDGAGSAIQCGESPNPRDLTLFPQVAAWSVARAGPIAAPVAWSDAPCASWSVKAAAPYTGPWNASTTPILVIGNRYDPSTAYASSQKMAALLHDARLLTVDGFGHTALLNASRCAADAESAYFIDGTLPPAGTVCKQDRAPFG
ncbi:alpha/beta hydrolase [Paraburkholderia sp.]|uniref:alpha/beta hydrolase n=1 Tax=Paraburkholderia sp. TaxID=1926495 RepID=UPI00238BE3DD|nr:alpha/beta hydrolase [Paraburkholderia sp.]MDE1178991.1 alpha/beta hydrolase [Paraburkholderia sp.]